MMQATSHIEAISFVAPGLPDWSHASAVLRGEQPCAASELAAYQPNLLPPNERRRASPTVRMAFRIAEELINSSRQDAAQLACVFSSSDGDLAIAQRICNALAESTRMVSPTDFHNSVHNAAAGYWSIAANAKGPATAISAFDDSFAIGLLEAHAMVQVEKQSTLLVVYDVPAPMPLHASRPLGIAAGVGLLVTPHRTAASIAAFQCDAGDGNGTRCDDAAIESLRISNPAARSLPLLQAIARQQSTAVEIAMSGQRTLRITLQIGAAEVHA
ncbi:MAG: beta-ketoacyl synthase chain length factor [Steroidobacter sp.]